MAEQEPEEVKRLKMFLQEWDKAPRFPFDKLEWMLFKQAEFQEKYKMYPTLDKVATAMASECLELWKAGKGKWWSKKEYTHDQKVEELADVLHFFLICMIVEHITPTELLKSYQKKLIENYMRQESKTY